MAAVAVKVLRKSLIQNLKDVKEVLDQFEATHSEAERERSADYKALVEGQFSIEGIVERIDSEFEKEYDRISSQEKEAEAINNGLKKMSQEKRAETFNSKKKENKRIGRFLNFVKGGIDRI